MRLSQFAFCQMIITFIVSEIFCFAFHKTLFNLFSFTLLLIQIYCHLIAAIVQVLFTNKNLNSTVFLQFFNVKLSSSSTCSLECTHIKERSACFHEELQRMSNKRQRAFPVSLDFKLQTEPD